MLICLCDLGLKKHHWVGAGINMYADKGGDLSFQHTGAQFSLAYHYAFSPDYEKILTLGMQYGISQRTINTENYKSAETLGGNMSDPDLLLLDNFNPSVSDFNLGISFKNWLSDDSYIDVGYSMYRILQPEYTFTGSSIRNKVARRSNAYVEYFIQSSDQLVLRPTIIYSRIINFQNLFGQFKMEYQANKKSSTIIKGGIGYRSDDALQMLAGVIYKGWEIGISYDLTVSTAAEYTNRFGGIELGIRKIIVTSTKPKLKRKVLCPQL